MRKVFEWIVRAGVMLTVGALLSSCATLDRGVGSSVLSQKSGSEDAIIMMIPVELIQDMVPSRHKLFLRDNKYARVVMLAVTYDENSLGGVDISHAKALHYWVRLIGEDDYQEIAGADYTLPTMYWFSLGGATTSPVLMERLRSKGLTIKPLIDVELTQEGLRGGGVAKISDNTAYEWTFDHVESPVSVVGMNHVLWSRDDDGRDFRHLIQAISDAADIGAKGTLTVSGSDSPLPSSLVGETVNVTVNRYPHFKSEVIWGETVE